MLKTLIKRSGKEQEFAPEKTNHWLIWGAKDIADRLDWSSIVMGARSAAPEKMTTQEWQMFLITALKTRGAMDDGWPYMLMAGRLYTVYLMKAIHGDKYPSLKEHLSMVYPKGVSRQLGYRDEELDFIDKFIIDHESNLSMAYPQVEQYFLKYSLRDRVTNEVFETPQFTIIRMAMAVCENDTPVTRLKRVKELYDSLVKDTINPPTPNYSALGTNHYGMASCCLISAADDAQSILAAGVIGYNMTLASGGLGIHLTTRGPGDPVDGGRVQHAGRLNYERFFVGATNANKQGMRGGALNIYDTVYSPEYEQNAMLQNPRTPVEVRERRVNVTYQTNAFFIKKAVRDEQYFTFTEFSAPDLYQAFFKADQTEFEQLYAKYEADPNFKKDYQSARRTLNLFMAQELEVSTVFWNDPSEMNRHTPFNDTVRQSNLCMEVMTPTAPWLNISDLYGDGDPTKGETGICNIGSIAIHNLPFDPRDPKIGFSEYKRAVRSMMEIIDYAIDNSEYHFPAIRTQAISRRNCSVGISGVATLMAKLNLKFNSDEGRRVWHMLNERHMYACIEVALELGKERGNAPWMHRTKWPEGWTPIDTYKKNIDKYVDNTLYFDWKDLSERVIENKGIRFSCLVAHMPGEQATRKGNGSNSIYPLIGLSVDKSDGSSATSWAALDNDIIGHQYQIAYDLSDEDTYIHYGICQKFTDQGGSFDDYMNRIAHPEISEEQLLNRATWRVRVGMKSKYYSRSLTDQGGKQKDIQITNTTPEQAVEGDGYEGAAMCTLDGNCGA